MVVRDVGLAAQPHEAVARHPVGVQRAAEVECSLPAIVAAHLHLDLAHRRDRGPLADHVDQSARRGLSVEYRRRALTTLVRSSPQGSMRGWE
ncbi:hypothetical protein [Paracidovorax cattleyae]|uniref:hypothetical protein n=1 Tax=Paracidovorax cattleyae TaxID=80868 RepID=UPI001E602F29|nr:hypothetical protein [Paracidovorax cattleyae]